MSSYTYAASIFQTMIFILSFLDSKDWQSYQMALIVKWSPPTLCNTICAYDCHLDTNTHSKYILKALIYLITLFDFSINFVTSVQLQLSWRHEINTLNKQYLMHGPLLASESIWFLDFAFQTQLVVFSDLQGVFAIIIWYWSGCKVKCFDNIKGK